MAGDRLSVADVARAVGVDRTTVYRWVTSGWLPAVKTGRRWEVDPEWIGWIKLWRDHQTHATKAIGFRLTPELYQILNDWAGRGDMTVQKAATWLWMRALQMEGINSPGLPVLIEDQKIETMIRERAKSWQVELPAAAAWLIVRGVAQLDNT